MIPLKDHNPSGSFPLVSYFLIGINVLVFFFSLALPEIELEGFINDYALIPALIVQRRQLYSLLTSMFMHGGLGHLLSNMLFLNIFGDNLEDKLGHFKYLFFYLFCGLGASALQIFVQPFSQIPNLGASGAIAGVMGGYLVLFPRHKIDILFSLGWGLRQTTVPAYFMLFYWFGAQLLTGFGSLTYLDETMGGVAYFAHIGGFLTGWLLIRLLVRPSKLFRS